MSQSIQFSILKPSQFVSQWVPVLILVSSPFVSNNGWLEALSQLQRLLRLGDLVGGCVLALGRGYLLFEPVDGVGEALVEGREDGTCLFYGFLLYMYLLAFIGLKYKN